MDSSNVTVLGRLGSLLALCEIFDYRARPEF